MPPDEIQRSLGRIESTLKALAQDIQQGRETEKQMLERLAGLEKWRAYLTGAWVVIAAVMAFIIKDK